ncbi:sugar transferase [Mucilaginibacter flavus]|uniref:sugar transferase n=1 Tax=Mucilaginibacter flavus TaxID=931504 RepID=UPI0025B41C77|nr:sugar transferase [Mucilaginibacter flavus]MDN3584408.1 sugar transferase [Mucilaginibacter flavus]
MQEITRIVTGNDLAPVVLFIYNRPLHTRKTLEALSRNLLADESVLYVFADGPKENATPGDLNLIAQAREVIKENQWCKEVVLVAREKNMNLEDNIIDGITRVINQYGKAIMLDDDLITSPYFLQYCNTGLQVYENDKQIFSINTYMLPIDFESTPETFLCPVATSSTGWATWADRWRLFDPNPAFINEIDTDAFLQNRFNVGLMNKMYMLKYMNTWDIRWYYTAFIRNGLGVFTTKSLTFNIGFDGSGTHKGGEDLVQELYTESMPVIYQDSINLKHYSKLLNFVKPDPVSFKQKIKNILKFLINYHPSG